MPISSIFTNSNYFSSYIDIKAISAPSSPNSGIGRLFYNTSTGKLSFKKSNGTVVDLESGGGGGTVESASNVGLGSGWFKTLNGTDLEFKSLIAGSNQLSITPNTNDLTLDVVEANIKLDDLGAPDDNTDLNASTTKHGLLPKLGGGTTNFLRADGTWSAPPGSGSSTGIGSNGGTASFDGDAVETVFTIPHLLGDVPTGVSVEPSSTDAFGDFQVDKDATNITVTYASAPPSGTGNVVFEWMAVVGAVQNVHVAKGFASKSGDASNKTFTIAHGMASTPASAWVNPSSTDALGEFTTDIDSTNITITYTIAPPSGTNNLEYYWGALTPTGGIVGDGEANTMSNLGAGSQVFKQKNIFDFEMRSIIGGTGLDATQNANDITIDIDNTVVTLTGSQTLTNKTLTAPVISTINNTGTVTLPTATTTLVGRDTTDTLTNKTFDADGTGNSISNIENADIKAAAGIVYSKLNLTDSVVNADINSAAAIAYSKLDLSDSIVNADIAAGAAIAKSKLASLAIVNADVDNAAAIAYSKLNLASSIVNADVSNSAAIAYSKLNLATSIVNADVSNSAAIAYSKLNLSGSIVNADISASAAIADSKLAQITDKAKLHSDIIYRQSTYNKYRDVHSPIYSTRKWGSLIGIVPTPLNNLELAVTAASGQGSATFTLSPSLGRIATHGTGTTTGNNAGGHVGFVFNRSLNPYWSFRGKLVSTTLLRVFWGLSSDASNSPSASDTYATSKSIAMIGARSTDTNFQFIHNDGSDPALYEDTGITIDNTVRTWEIFGDDSGARFGWAVDGGAITWYTNQVPASTTSLGIVHEIQTNESGVAKSFNILAIYIEFDTK